MSTSKSPKVLLFDVGGVCVVSPFKGILEYELSQGIPPGWVNFSISASKPNGVWHQLERGEIPMDREFFKRFGADLSNPQRWETFYRGLAKKANVEVTKIPPVPKMDGEFMFNRMMTLSRDPDPWMWPALQKLKESGKYLLGGLSNTMIFPDDHPLSKPSDHDKVRGIFDVFVSSAHVGMRKPAPDIYEFCLKQLDKYAKENANGKGKGLGWENGIKPGDIVFLDDIGENLREAKRQGFGTLKVNLGQAYEAVAELEKITGLQLDGGHPKISDAPKIPSPKL